jgi:hypothetical protein
LRYGGNRGGTEIGGAPFLPFIFQYWKAVMLTAADGMEAEIDLLVFMYI